MPLVTVATQAVKECTFQPTNNPLVLSEQWLGQKTCFHESASDTNTDKRPAEFQPQLTLVTSDFFFPASIA